MWVVAEYQPVTLFSFRSGEATSSGAKTLFLPTPFAVRTALLDAAIRTKGCPYGEEAFTWIKELSLAVRPPERVVVTNLFAKILKPTRKETAEGAMDRTIAFREYAYLEGTLTMAFGVVEERIPELVALLIQINYFGRRGCLFQLVRPPCQVPEPPPEFIPLDGVYVQGTQVKGQMPSAFQLGIVQMMDDWGASLTFSKVSIYSPEKIELGKDRIRKGIVLPYRLVRASKDFSYYERIPLSGDTRGVLKA